MSILSILFFFFFSPSSHSSNEGCEREGRKKAFMAFTPFVYYLHIEKSFVFGRLFYARAQLVVVGLNTEREMEMHAWAKIIYGMGRRKKKKYGKTSFETAVLSLSRSLARALKEDARKEREREREREGEEKRREEERERERCRRMPNDCLTTT